MKKCIYVELYSLANFLCFYFQDAKITQTLEHRSKFHDCCYYTLEDTEYLISGHEDKTIRMWNATTGECVVEMKQAHDFRIKTVSTLESNGTTVLVSTSSDGWIKCWDTKEILDKNGKDAEPLGQYNTKSRITCCALHQGFGKTEGDQ